MKKQTLNIITRDYTSFFATITPLVILIMAAIPYVFGSVEIQRTYGRVSEFNIESSTFFFLLAFALSIVTIFIYFFRVNVIKRILNTGSIVKGKIIYSEFDRGRGYILYTYIVNKKTYTTRNMITAASNLQKNHPVTIRYNKINPKQAFVHEIYV